MEQKSVIKGGNLKAANKDLSKKKSLLARKKTEEFKQSYRRFYDDVKLSDREDW